MRASREGVCDLSEFSRRLLASLHWERICARPLLGPLTRLTCQAVRHVITSMNVIARGVGYAIRRPRRSWDDFVRSAAPMPRYAAELMVVKISRVMNAL